MKFAIFCHAKFWHAKGKLSGLITNKLDFHAFFRIFSEKEFLRQIAYFLLNELKINMDNKFDIIFIFLRMLLYKNKIGGSSDSYDDVCYSVFSIVYV